MSHQIQSPRAGVELLLDRIANDVRFRQQVLVDPTSALGDLPGLRDQQAPEAVAGYAKPLCGPYSCSKSCGRTCAETYR